ncbi:tripartite tricarboxylate transporter TctB family protein [Halopseudomonas pelagia]|uniref:Tripartite tricarboxylate transporter TctB family protein n=1 Tax=Halopseudomonas pelagia TaxID=553151 RepID=A0AA91U044_9GAMM|nr:tripartite tricarboxylate transporter TctB family protein [Halopseudomonas pelagia]PCC98159.1 hypothetical protein CO192_17060 [Halopseudomonas pelagia]QFY57319.1 tripartite tricarboxylate transporter TctB family protein [Halopseudomonas pelagia]
MLERNLNLWAGLTITVAGLIGIFYLVPNHIGSGFGFGLSPQFFPYLCLGAITALGALLFFSRLRNSEMEQNRIDLSRSTLLPLLLFMGVMALGLLLMSLVGYLVGAMVLVAAFMLAMGERRISWIVPTAVIWPLLMWLLFGVVLGTPLN